MDQEMSDRWEAYLRERANRAFGDVDKVSGRTLQPFSLALHQAAENLITKAMRVWRTDRARGIAYVKRAVALPFDDHEEVFPVVTAAEMRLYTFLSDELEYCEDEGAWLIAVLGVLQGTEGMARFVLRDVLRAVVESWELPRREQRTLDAALDVIPAHVELRDMPDLTPAELTDIIVEVLDVCTASEDAFEEAAVGPE